MIVRIIKAEVCVICLSLRPLASASVTDNTNIGLDNSRYPKALIRHLGLNFAAFFSFTLRRL